MSAHAGFFVTGGTLVPDAPCYVERAADRHLYEGLRRSEFCYVLTPRQMGKSSLMVRTAVRLRAEGVCVAVLDLTMVGQMLTQEQWYYGLLQALAQQTRTRHEVRAFWAEQELLGPLQRWMAALREVVLPRCSGQLVIFVDEIDAVRSLPFNTDEFFAAIRECYNRRPHDPEMHRLTFCLVGVATPSDLIQDPRTTPFNIGRRIDLDDFTETEAAPLAAGFAQELGDPDAVSTAEKRELLQRVLYWTGGHPYLTQRLCQAVSERIKEGASAHSSRSSPPRYPNRNLHPNRPQSPSSFRLHPSKHPSDVDILCEELFLAPGARERDDNLMFVRERLLRSGTDLGGLLELYGQVWRKKAIKDDALHPLISILRLSGIVRSVNGRLVVRNRIYAGAFDPEWVRSAMPDAEVRRQRKAYIRGMFRAAALSTALLVASVASYVAYHQFTRAEQRGESLRLNRYVDDMRAAQQALAAGEMAQAEKLLARYSPQPGERDLRGFEWHYLSSLLERPPLTLPTPPGIANHLAFLPDGRTLIRAGLYYHTQYWDAETRRETHTVPEPQDFSRTARENPNWTWHDPAVDGTGSLMVRAAAHVAPPGSPPNATKWEVTLVRMRTGEETHICHPSGWISSTALSPDGKLLALGRVDPPTNRKQSARVELWSTTPPRRISELTLPEKSVGLLSFSPNGRLLAGAVDGSNVRIFPLAERGLTGHTGTLLTGHKPAASCLEFSPDSRHLAVGTYTPGMQGETPGIVMVWRSADGKLIGNLSGHRLGISDLSWSGPAHYLATLGREGVVRIWNWQSQREVANLATLGKGPGRVALSRDGKFLAIDEGSGKVVVRLLPETANPRFDSGTDFPVHAMAFSTGGDQAAIHTRSGRRDYWTLHSKGTLLVRREFRSVPQAYSPELQVLARAEHENIVLTGLADQRLIRVASTIGKVQALAFAHGGTHLLAVGETGKLALFEAGKWSPQVVQTLPRGYTLLAASRNAERIAIYSSKTQLLLWDRIHEDKPRKVSADAEGPIQLTSDGQWLTFASPTGISFIHCVSGKQRFFPTTNQGTKEGFAISPDATTLATVNGRERTVQLWNVETARPTITIPSLPSAVSSLTFVTNPTRLAVGLMDGTVVLIPRSSRP